MSEIQFSPDIISALPQFLNTNWEQLIKMTSYTKAYIYNAVKGKAPISQQLNTQLNLLWMELSLDYEDLEAIYSLIEITALGDKKMKQYKLKQHRTNKSMEVK